MNMVGDPDGPTPAPTPLLSNHCLERIMDVAWALQRPCTYEMMHVHNGGCRGCIRTLELERTCERTAPAAVGQASKA